MNLRCRKRKGNRKVGGGIEIEKVEKQNDDDKEEEEAEGEEEEQQPEEEEEAGVRERAQWPGPITTDKQRGRQARAY